MPRTDTHVYILEYKLDKSPQEALEQIHRKRYYRSAWERGKPVSAIGVQFSSRSRNIEAWEVEEMGQGGKALFTQPQGGRGGKKVIFWPFTSSLSAQSLFDPSIIPLATSLMNG